MVKAADRSVLVLKDNGMKDVRRILVPVGSGPHSKLGLTVAQQLAAEWGATITAMTVQVGQGPAKADSDFERESVHLFQSFAEDFVRNALKETGVDAEVMIAIGTEVDQTIIDTAKDHDLVVIGASEEWAVRQWLFGSLPDKVANRASASVLMVRSKD